MNKLDSSATTEKLYPYCDETIWSRSCDEEILEPIPGKVSGKIPSWVNGSLLRNGPGKLSFGCDKFKHLFDGSALLHRFAIANGSVTYQCRFLQTNSYLKNSAAKRIVVTEFGTKAVKDPCLSIFEKFSGLFNTGDSMSDNAMISIYPFGDELYAFSESPVMFKFNERNLETTKRVNLSREIGIVHHTSHPHILNNGCVYNLGTIVTKFGPKYCIVEFPQGKDFHEAKIVASILPRRRLNPSYMHTFGITENFFILIEQPLTVSVKLMSQTLWKNDPLIDSLRWFGKKTTKFHILSRKSGHTERTFYAETFFFFHVINSYEEDNHIVVDICCYENPDIIKGMYLNSFRTMQSNPNYSSMFHAKPLRFVLPLNAPKELFEDSKLIEKEDQKNCNLIKLNGSKAQAKIQKNGRILCIPEELCETSCDLPRINYSNNSGLNYRYFYAMSSDFSNGGSIIKVDVKNKTQTTWSEKNCYPGEPVFLSAPNAASEDDGVVLSVLLRGNNQENHVELLVLCAKDLKVLARCEFITPSPVPRCVHGWFKFDN